MPKVHTIRLNRRGQGIWSLHSHTSSINILTHWRYDSNFTCNVATYSNQWYLGHIQWNCLWGVPQNFTGSKLILVWVMAWWHQTTKQYLNRCRHTVSLGANDLRSAKNGRVIDGMISLKLLVFLPTKLNVALWLFRSNYIWVNNGQSNDLLPGAPIY